MARDSQTPRPDKEKIIAARQVRFRERGSTFYRVKELLLADQLRSYTCIADEVGITHERVRQIAKDCGETGRERGLFRKQLAFEAITLPPRAFDRRARKWLMECGYFYCSIEKHEGPRVLTLEQFGASRYRCKACQAREHREALIANPKRREYAQRYAKSERGKEKQRRAIQRYREKHPKRYKYNSEDYKIKMQDPVYAEKKRAMDRKQAERRKALRAAKRQATA
jgi:hypothetical protein